MADTVRRYGGWRVLVLVLVLVAFLVSLAGDASQAVAQLPTGGSFPLMLGLIGIVPLVPRSYQDLERIAFPSQTKQPELIPHILWDSLTYTSGTTTQLIFFRAAQANPLLGNMLSGGQLPAPNWFEIHGFLFDLLIDATTVAGGETGALDDVAKIMLVGSPTFLLDLQGKNYGPYPLRVIHGSGGPVGVGYGTFTAEESIQVANNSNPDGGWNWQGKVVIPPMANFNVTVTWNAAQTLASGNSVLSLGMYGALHRPIK